MRTIQWGNSGITFIKNGRIIGELYFPLGPQGPIDGTIGSPERRKYEKICEDWKEKEVLPKGIILA